jgi:putative CRISPR-associated protein (TIGR02619 family)
LKGECNMAPANILICTVGTSLFRPNLEALRQRLEDPKLDERSRHLAEAYQGQNWEKVAEALLAFDPQEQVCGAEINSTANLLERNYVSDKCGLYFMHSDTADGENIARVLVHYYQMRGHAPVQAIKIADLQDSDPARFRVRGLRNLTREICRVIRQYSTYTCAINATAGYKAQIAIAVLLGQALGVPVYYKHERFSEIISFPPIPVALDFEVWMRASGMLFDLEASSEPVPAELYIADWDERYESLVERIEVDGRIYLDLSPVGQIFHETLKHRFRSYHNRLLPPPAEEKRPPKITQRIKNQKLKDFLQRLTDEVPQVIQCATVSTASESPERTGFRLRKGRIEGIFRDGSSSVRFYVETTARNESEALAMVAKLNEWLYSAS